MSKIFDALAEAGEASGNYPTRMKKRSFAAARYLRRKVAGGGIIVLGDLTAVGGGPTSYPTNAFTPNTNDLLVAFVAARTTVAAGTMTSSVGGKTFTKVTSALWGGSANTLYCFVADQLANGVSQILTFDCTGDAANSCCIAVLRIKGMTKTGLTAIKQSAKAENAAGSTVPAPVFAGSALITNPILGAVANNSNPAVVTEPADWKEMADTGFSSTIIGMEVAIKDKGFNGTTVTWGGQSPSVHGDLIVELDIS